MRQLQIFTYFSRTFFSSFQMRPQILAFLFHFRCSWNDKYEFNQWSKILIFCGFHVKNSPNQKHSLKFVYCRRAVESFWVSLIALTVKWHSLTGRTEYAIVSFFESASYSSEEFLQSLVSRIFNIHSPSVNEPVESECFSHGNLRLLAQ